MRVGIIGCGGISRKHANVIRAKGQLQLAAVCDLNMEAARRLAAETGARPYNDHREMLERERLEIVAITTPPAVRLELICDAAEAGAHIFCEKPLACSSEEGRRIVEAANAAGVVLFVGYCHRFHPPVVALKSLIVDGRLGRLTAFRNRFGWAVKDIDQARGRGGVLLDNGSHSVDLFRFLVGEVDAACASSPQAEAPILELFDCFALLKSRDGVTGIIELNANTIGSLNCIEVYGTEGSAQVCYWGPYASRYQIGNEQHPLPEEGDRFVGEWEHFLRAIDRAEPVAISGEEGVRDLEVIEAIYRSLAEEKWVEVRSGQEDK